MELLNGIGVTKNRKGEVWSNVLTKSRWQQITDITAKKFLLLAKQYKCSKRYTDDDVKTCLIHAIDALTNSNGNEQTIEQETVQPELSLEEKAISICDRLINFFKEFSFEPNFRFVNTLQGLSNSNKLSKAYISNYFALTDNSFAQSIVEKMKSHEFNQLLTDISELPLTHQQVNKRFKLYYGSQGTGKTTEAMKETNDNVMVCHSAMLPSDLMEDFAFDDGKATFRPSALYKAMTEGQPIVLDEINLLPFESLRFLQSLLDGKTQFEYKGQTVNIVDGFKIIGTMNLQVNGITYALPEPLVDRACELRKFELTADTLAKVLL